ncbi:hypothetical protein [Brevundimonas sp.]|uniref:hypothetical protein n=1 Tax=Brevundimonas sp. TaxID=1871086 RepID=UPI001A1CBB00|nr:hypothetical protein [Brevundimonas sp.]MBJ7484204.1 hypothetical protein [Brevundimonas sp.]
MIKNYGTCVGVRHRLDGTSQFRFAVRRNCPKGWKKTIPILVDGRDSVVLEQMTAAQEAQVEQRADELFRQLEAMRAGEFAPNDTVPPKIERSWEHLIELRRELSWEDLKPASRRTYASTQKTLLKMFGGDPSLAPSVVVESQTDKIIKARLKSPHQRKKAFQELSVLIRKAIREGWRSAGMEVASKSRIPDAPIRLWSPGELHCAVTAAIQTGERGLALLMISQWEIGQRLQSVRNFRYGTHYKNGVFRYRCVKGERPIEIEILNRSARRVLDDNYREGEWMFPKGDTGKPFTGPELSKAYTRIRKSVPGFDQKLQLRQLRHTVICELAKADCNALEISTITSHDIDTVHRTLKHYFVNNTEMARHAMEKRERRRLDNVTGMNGEFIIEATRRIFIGDRPKSEVPTPLVETTYYEA